MRSFNFSIENRVFLFEIVFYIEKYFVFFYKSKHDYLINRFFKKISLSKKIIKLLSFVSIIFITNCGETPISSGFSQTQTPIIINMPSSIIILSQSIRTQYINPWNVSNRLYLWAGMSGVLWNLIPMAISSISSEN